MKYIQKVRGTTEQFKVKGLFSCFVLNLRMSSESCLIFNWHSSRAASGISFLEYQQRATNTAETGETTLLQLLFVL